MHLSRESRATLVAAVILAGIPVLSLAAPATADPFKAGTCTIVGTADDDVLTGTDGDDVICALGGDDKITGGGGDDVLRGGGGTDVVRGGPGDDVVAGGGGDDRVFGQAGDDKVRGDAGDDEVVGGPGDDRLGGYKGADELDGVDSPGAADVLRCGPGPDTAAADPGDQVKKNCETVVQNDPPTDIALVPATIPENEPIGTDIGDLAATDPDSGDAHTFTLVTGTGSTDNALVRVDGDSLESNVRYDFEADSSFSVRVRATDDAGEFTEKAFTVTVTNANDAPVAVDDDATTNEDTSLVVPVSGPSSFAANDTDQDGDSLAVSAATAVAGGTASVSAGMVTFAPNPNLCGNDAGVFDYTVSDGHGGTDTGRVSVDITCVDDLANAVDDSRTVAEDSGGTVFNVLSNDSDPENDPISVTAVTQPANPSSSTSFTASGVTYTPGANYCNDPGAPADDTFTYTVTGGDSATVSVKVTCVNDAPDANNDTRSTTEDTTLVLTVATAGSPTNNDTDVDGDTLIVTAVSSPVGGTVTVTAGTVTFVPTPNLCGAGAGSFGYTVSDGVLTDTASVTVDITCVNDPANAVDDTATVAEDSGGTPISVLTNDTDVEGNAITVTDASNPANGTASFTAGGVTYTPDPDFCGTDTFTYEVNGGEDTATVTVTVTCANDAPVVDLDSTTAGNGSAATFTESDPHTGTGVLIAPNVDITDVDDAMIESATITLTNRPNGSNETIAPPGSLPSGITVSGTSGPGSQELVLTGPASVAAFETAIAGIRYDNLVNPPNPADRIITVVVNDGDANSVSRTATVQVVPLNLPPDVDLDTSQPGNDGTASFVENGGAPTITFGPDITDADDTNLEGLTVVLTNRPDNAAESLLFAIPGGSGITAVGGGYDSGTGTLAFTGTSSIANYETLLGSVLYTNSSDTPTTTNRIVTVKVNDGLADSPTRTSTVSVTASNDAPVNTVPGAQTTPEDAAKVIAGISVADPDDTNLTITLSVTNGTLTLGSLAGLSFNAGDGTSDASMEFTGTKADVNSALASVTYSPTPNFNGGALLTLVADDGSNSDTDTVAITVTAVNDAPTSTDPGAQTTNEDIAKVITGMVVADVDNASLTVTLSVTNGTLTLASTAGLAFTVGDGTTDTTMTFSGTIASVNTAIASVSYNPTANYSGSSVLTFTVTDGIASPVVKTVNITVVPVNDAPVAASDSYDAIGNTGLFVGTTRPATQAGKEITGSVLDNDSDIETAQASLVAEVVTNAPTTLGGTITIQSDGNFTYHPDDVDTGVTDTFTYRVCDTTPCNSGTDANATGTLSLPIAGQVWYVRNNEPAGGDGTSDTPFDTLAEAEAASGTGDTVFVFDGSNTTTNLDTGYAMNANERLIGESRPLSLDPDGGGPLPTSPLHPGTSGAQPTLTASNEDVVALASTVLVDGVDVDPSGTGGGISGGAGVDAITVQNVNVTDTGTAGTQPGIEMDGTTGVNRFTGVTVTNGGSATAIGVRINNADRVLFADTATNTIATAGAKALDAASTSLLTSRWNDITVTGSGTGAIRLSSTTGQPVLGDGSGTDLSLQTTSGATAALDVASSNTVTVDTAGTDTISATGGPAADIRNSNGSQFFFDSASSTNSAGDGVNLDTNLTAPVEINAGTIAGSAGIAFDVNGGGLGGTVTYGGAINDGPGQSVEVTGRDGGGVTLSGNIDDSGDAGGGIVVSGNSAGSTTFSGASKVLNTGAGNAVAMSANGSPAGGHLVSFDNGGLDIDTTSGSGFSAVNGTLTVGGIGNTVDTGTGRALYVDSAGITSGNLTFARISSNGAVNGIRLNNTGATGRLVVTGTGGTCTFPTPTCTGGNIANSTSDGIALINTASPTFTRMNVHDGAGNGMLASGVSALSIDNSIFVDNSDDIATNNEANLRMDNVTGSSSVTNSLFREARVNEVYWTPTTAIATMAWTNNTVGPDNAGELGSGLLLNPTGTATTTLNVSGGSFAGNNGDSLRPAGSDQSATTVNVTGGTTFLDSNSGVNFSVDDDADLTFNVSGSTFTRHASHALQMIVNDNTTASSIVRGKALNNIIGNGTADSGSRDANGISYDLEGAADIVLNVSNNTIRNTDTQGIFIQSVRFPSGTPNVGPNVDLTLRDNTVTNIDDNSAFPFGFQHGTQVEARRNSSMCLDIAGNTSTGIGGAEHFRVRQRDASTFRLERLTGSATDPANLSAFIAGQNDAGSTASATVATTFTAVANGFCDDVP